MSDPQSLHLRSDVQYKFNTPKHAYLYITQKIKFALHTQPLPLQKLAVYGSH